MNHFVPTWQHRLGIVASWALLECGCARSSEPVPQPVRGTTSSVVASPKTRAQANSTNPNSERPPTTNAFAPNEQVERRNYPWLSDASCGHQEVTTPLTAQFAPPPGFVRVNVPKASFGEWLRGLPLRPPGDVVDYKGRVVLSRGDPRFAAVVALDEGTLDLQQCADSIVRLHAEWQWSKGERNISYRAASGTPMPFSRFLAGERPKANGNSLLWEPSARASDPNDHGAFRKYLDSVFMWANTGALGRDAKKSALESLRPGDFFVLAGAPGHAVLVLDVAIQGKNQVALLGQGYMPAQSFHVLASGEKTPWFALDADASGVQTPFWPSPFPWSSLRRLD